MRHDMTNFEFFVCIILIMILWGLAGAIGN